MANLIIRKVFSKFDYDEVCKNKRKEFIEKHFDNILYPHFGSLREEAINMKSCNHEIIFNIPDHFDVDKIENMLCLYFSDLGYNVLPEPRKNITNKIQLNIT